MNNNIMRLDKYLKVSRIIKRRALAKEAVDNNLILVNKKVSKASKKVNVGDIISFKNENYRVLKILNYATEETAKSMYEIIK